MVFERTKRAARYLLLAAPIALVATSCQPECVDLYDCRGKNTKDGGTTITYTCVDNKCVQGSPVNPDAGS